MVQHDVSDRRGAEVSMARRGALAGLGALGLGALGATPAAQAAGTPLPVLGPGDNWATTLASTPAVQLQAGATYTLSSTVDLPNNCLIVGNGATVTVASASMTAFTINARSNVTLVDIHLLGQSANPVGSAPNFGHVGVRVTRSTNVRISGCDFSHWLGAGVVFTGSTGDDYMAYRCKVSDNAFHRCYFGVSMADRAEYGLVTGNSFASCRLAIWNSAGNWAIVGNSIVACYGGYYSIASTSPYGSLASDNWGHGSFIGNTVNHATSGSAVSWSANTAFPIGGTSRDPGSGVVVERVLPPTFTGNTMWYSNLTASNISGTGWLLSGCTFSNLTITCSGTAPVHLVGTQSNTGNAAVLSGNVRDLLPG